MLTVQRAANGCYRERAIKSSLNFKMKLWARLHMSPIKNIYLFICKHMLYVRVSCITLYFLPVPTRKVFPVHFCPSHIHLNCPHIHCLANTPFPKITNYKVTFTGQFIPNIILIIKKFESTCKLLCTHTYGSCKITIFRMNMPAKYFFPWMHLPILLLQLLITNVSCIVLTSQKPFRTFRFSSPCKFSGNAKNKVSTESTPSSHIAFAHEKKLNINNLVIIGIKEDQMVGRHLEEVPKHSQYSVSVLYKNTAHSSNSCSLKLQPKELSQLTTSYHCKLHVLPS